MRNTLAVKWLRRKALPVVLAGGLCVCGWGCHQHYYYYGNPPAGIGGCPPGTTVLPSAVSVGPLCDVPAPSTVSSTTSRSTTVSDGRKSRVVVSESSNSRSPLSWRPSDPDASPGMAQVEVEGALPDPTVRK